MDGHTPRDAMNPPTDTTGHIPWEPPGPMPEGAHSWRLMDSERLEREWLELRPRISEHPEKERFLQVWLEERARRFAIETGQIEGLYTLKPGITEQLVAEGFASVAGTDACESLDDEELRGLLEDQEAAYHMMREDTSSGQELRLFSIKEWHGLLTRHQVTVAGVTHGGWRVQAPFERKGAWKRKPNTTVMPDGAHPEKSKPVGCTPARERRRACQRGNRRERQRIAIMPLTRDFKVKREGVAPA